jgi:hypothetical protein
MARRHTAGPARAESAKRTRAGADAVHSPAHYTAGGIETRDFIAAKNLNWGRGNVVKYVVRAGIKSRATELEDLQKARACLDHEIALLRGGR